MPGSPAFADSIEFFFSLDTYVYNGLPSPSPAAGTCLPSPSLNSLDRHPLFLFLALYNPSAYPFPLRCRLEFRLSWALATDVAGSRKPPWQPVTYMMLCLIPASESFFHQLFSRLWEGAIGVLHDTAPSLHLMYDSAYMAVSATPTRDVGCRLWADQTRICVSQHAQIFGDEPCATAGMHEPIYGDRLWLYPLPFITSSHRPIHEAEPPSVFSAPVLSLDDDAELFRSVKPLIRETLTESIKCHAMQSRLVRNSS